MNAPAADTSGVTYQVKPTYMPKRNPPFRCVVSDSFSRCIGVVDGDTEDGALRGGRDLVAALVARGGLP